MVSILHGLAEDSLLDQTTLVLIVDKIERVVRPYFLHLFDILFEGHLQESVKHNERKITTPPTSPCAWMITSRMGVSFFFRSKS